MLRWAELVTKNEAKRDRECWEDLRRRFTPQQLVELTAVICLFNLMNRFNDSLQLDLETPPGGLRSLKVPPEKLARYARDVLAREPEGGGG